MKIKVGVLYGGKTTEHEVSIITAVQAMGYLNTDKYEVIPLYLTKENEMYTGGSLMDMDVYREPDLLKRYCTNVVMYNKNGAIILQNKKGIFKRTVKEIDIVIHKPVASKDDTISDSEKDFLRDLIIYALDKKDDETEVIRNCDDLTSSLECDGLVFSSDSMPITNMFDEVSLLHNNKLDNANKKQLKLEGF